MAEYLLEMKNITKEFPSVKALDGVNFALKPGSIHALMGENGAGKSTLMNCLFGMIAPDGGEILLEGKPIRFRNPKDALEHGVAMVHQELNQALKRSVMDNIWLGRYPTALGIYTLEGKMVKDTEEIFRRLNIHVDPRRIMSTMSVSDRQMVEIAKAVSYDSKIIVLDEPTSSLNEREAEHLFDILDTLKARGCGIVYISHKMEEILRISDEVSVMRDGRLVATKPAAELTMEHIIRLMVGRELDNRFPVKQSTIGEEILRVEGLSARYAPVTDVSFSLRKGEIVGVAGLGGAGRTELLESLFGLLTRKSGQLFLHGKEIRNRTPGEAKRNGFALLTEERRAGGIFGVLDITDNTVISGLGRYRVGGLFLSERKMRADTDWSIGAMRIKTPSKQAKIRTLSGGNQQKVILGRWLLTEPEILLLDEPTRGIDVGAKYEIYQLMLDLAAKEKAILMVSSEMPELIGVCDRILVMSGGRLAGEVAVPRDQEGTLTADAKELQ
ncbi:MAG: ATP-binding cassette domain-containing protein, partial [Clostridia bacterium]|nr:ATP-binding cassette domain-containing protein [Clostridia bacterium]